MLSMSAPWMPTSIRPIDAEAVQQMELDLPRTHPDDLRVTARLGMVRAMMVRHIVEDPEIGYCQGLNCVAAVFAVAAGAQEEAYTRFRAFTQRVRRLWLPGLPLFKEGVVQFTALAETRAWYKHLQTKAVDPSMYLPQAWMPLFALWLPLSVLVESLELMEQEGFAGLMSITLATLDHTALDILEQQKLNGLMATLGDLREHAPCAGDLLTAAYRWLPAAIALGSGASAATAPDPPYDLSAAGTIAL